MARSTQNAGLRDILMLKLVSYYEDKYKLSRVDGVATTTRTTEPLALERLFDNPEFNRYPNTKHNNRRGTATKRTIARRRRYPNANSSGSSRVGLKTCYYITTTLFKIEDLFICVHSSCFRWSRNNNLYHLLWTEQLLLKSLLCY